MGSQDRLWVAKTGCGKQLYYDCHIFLNESCVHKLLEDEDLVTDDISAIVCLLLLTISICNFTNPTKTSLLPITARVIVM